MRSVKLGHLPHLDGLRGVAVLAVIFFHAFPAALPGGFIGVDIFFVLSGFLITRILFADLGAPGATLVEVGRNFYARRIRRIFPALLLVLIACYVLAFFVLLPSELAKLAGQIVASAGFYLNYVLSGREPYFEAASSSNPLLHLWSLGIEEQFYLLWPFVIWLTLRCRLNPLPVVVFLAAASYFWNAQKYSESAAAAFYLPQMRMWELLIGAFAATIVSGRVHPTRPKWAGEIIALVGLALIGTGLLTIKEDFTLPNQWTLLPTLGAACVIWSAASAWINRKVLGNPLLVGIGLISYPLYLWHWPLLVFAQISRDRPSSLALRWALLGVAGALAWLTWWLVENPIRRARRLGPLAIGLAVAMLVVAGGSEFTRHEAGFPSRFAPLIGEIAAYNYDPAQATRLGTYLLMGDQDETKFKHDPNEILKGKPTLYLWGDSHAAALYPGLASVYGGKYNIVQRTAAKTPPFMAEYFNPGNAHRINQFVFQSIVQDRPELVLLEANWPAYEWPKIEATVVALKAAGIHRIVLVGPVPQWIGSLPQQLFGYVRRHRDVPVPVRLKEGADPSPAKVDRLMAELGQRLGIEYISPCQILGDRDGFLILTGNTADSLMSFDSSHLTASGSRYLVSHFPAL